MKPQRVLFFFTITLCLVVFAVADNANGGFQGVYELTTNLTDGKYGKYLEVSGINAEGRQKIQSAKTVKIRIFKPKGNKYTFESKVDINILRINFVSGKEFEINLGDGTRAKNTITADPDAKTAKRVVQLPGGEATQEATFTPEGFSLTMKCKDAVAELKFKRLNTKSL